MLIRYFAAARHAVGLDEEELWTGADAPGPLTLAEVRAGLLVRHPALSGVLPLCSLLVDEVAATDGDRRVPGTATVDVLPPFAGG